MTSYLEMKGARVLITGGAGFVGGNLARRLLDEGVADIHLVDNFLSAERSNVPNDPRVRLTAASITNDAVLAGLQDDIDFVFHLATYHGNQSSIHDPLADHENNTLTTLKLYERIRNFGRLRKVVYSAAGCAIAEKTFGTATETEESELVSLHNNDSPYSMSKVFGEFYSVYYHKQHKLPTVRARFQNVYGPGEILGAGEWRGTPATVWRNVTPTFIYKAIKGQPLPLENDGVATRDFIYVADIVEGLIACAVKGEAGDVYNLASGRETSIRDLAMSINELTSNTAGLHDLPKRPWDNSGKRYGSTQKSKRVLHFEAATGIAEGLRITVDWTKKNIGLIDQAIAKHASRL